MGLVLHLRITLEGIMAKKISMAEYNARMSKIIKMGKPVVDTLCDMLDEASKYDIKGVKNETNKRKLSRRNKKDGK